MKLDKKQNAKISKEQVSYKILRKFYDCVGV